MGPGGVGMPMAPQSVSISKLSPGAQLRKDEWGQTRAEWILATRYP